MTATARPTIGLHLLCLFTRCRAGGHRMLQTLMPNVSNSPAICAIVVVVVALQSRFTVDRPTEWTSIKYRLRSASLMNLRLAHLYQVWGQSQSTKTDISSHITYWAFQSLSRLLVRPSVQWQRQIDVGGEGWRGCADAAPSGVQKQPIWWEVRGAKPQKAEHFCIPGSNSILLAVL